MAVAFGVVALAGLLGLALGWLSRRDQQRDLENRLRYAQSVAEGWKKHNLQNAQKVTELLEEIERLRNVARCALCGRAVDVSPVGPNGELLCARHGTLPESEQVKRFGEMLS